MWWNRVEAADDHTATTYPCRHTNIGDCYRRERRSKNLSRWGFTFVSMARSVHLLDASGQSVAPSDNRVIRRVGNDRGMSGGRGG